MTAHRDSTQACVVLGLETQIGLNVVRELGRAGVPVIGIAQDPAAIGLRSKHLHEGIVVRQPRSPELLAALRGIGQRHGNCPLLAISEVNLLWLAEHRKELGSILPVLPDPRPLAIVLDKAATLRAAAAVGIETPRTWQPVSELDIQAQVADFPLPAVLKWSDQNSALPHLEAKQLPLLKAEFVHSTAELRQSLERYVPISRWPLVQEYCGGYGLGQFFFMQGGQALRIFQHRRIAEWPPEGGFSSVCDAVPLSEHAELQQMSVNLLRHIGWSGVAMVEYRFDPQLNRARLMEINGRFWGSFPLAYYCGAGFALLAYRHALGLPLDQLPQPRTDLRCRMVATELKRMVRILFQPAKIADRTFEVHPARELVRFATDFFRPRVRYYVWSRGDPWPFLADIRNLLTRRGQ